jgi:hypothetical protein
MDLDLHQPAASSSFRTLFEPEGYQLMADGDCEDHVYQEQRMLNRTTD